MTDSAAGGGDRPFTLFVCGDCKAISDQVVDHLRRTVRETRHAVMVSTTCLGTALHCWGPRGVRAVVQPCTQGRRPTGAAVLLGPLVSSADAEAVGTWLRTGMPDDGTLPTRLRVMPPAAEHRPRD